MKKNSLIFKLIIPVLVLMFFSDYQANSQEVTEEQDFVNSSLIELFTKIAEKESKDTSEIKLSTEEEKQSQKELKKTQEKLVDAEKTLRSTILMEDLSRTRVKSIYTRHGGAQSVNENKIDEANQRLEAAVYRRTEVETEVRILQQKQEIFITERSKNC